MAKITLNIEASDSTDLADTISSLMYLSAYKSEPPITNETDDGFEQMNAGATQDAEPGERQRRTRRTKAQIEADNAAEKTVQGETAAPGASASQPSPSKASGSDVFGDQLKEVTHEAAAGEVSKAMIADAMQHSVAHRGAPATQTLIIEHGAGAKSLSAIDPTHYAAVHAALMAD